MLPWRASYTITQSEFLTSFQSFDPQFGDVKAGDEIPYVPQHQASGSIGVETRRFGVNLGATFVDRMRERAGQTEDGLFTDSYFLLDLGAQYRINKWLAVYANGRNLTDSAYIVARRPYGARPGAPRWIQLGIKADF
jgi:Fe(3+) dicitrate transport protein